MPTILYVDPDASRRRDRRTTLEAAGFEVLDQDPDEAARGEGQAADLILLAESPGDGGFAGTAGQLLSSSSSRAAPLILLAHDAATAPGALAAGADAFLLEPVAPELLVAQAEALLRLCERGRSAEAELQRSEERFRRGEARLQATFDNAGVGLVEVEGDDHFIAVNNRVCEILRRPREQLLAMNVHQLTWPEDRPLSDRINRELHEGSSDRADYEKRYTRGDGTPVWAHVTVSPIRDARGRWIRSITTIQDISDRKRAEAELKLLAQQREIALSAARMGWWHYDPETKISTWDERYAEIFDVAGRERPNEEILQRLHPDDLPAVWAAVEAALDPVEPKPYAAEYRIFRGDGSVRWVEAHGLATFEGDGPNRRATSLVGTVRDITDRKQADEELQRAHALIEGIARGTGDLIAAEDREFRFLFFNDAYRDEFRQLWGREIEIGTSMAEALEPWPGDRRKAMLLWGRALNGESFSVTEEFGPPGARQVYDLHFSPVRDRDGALLGASHILRNVTERVRLEDELRAARIAAEQASRAKDHFLAVLSHELRTPLTPVLTAVSMLQDRYDLDPADRETLEMVQRNVELEARLIDDLLDVTRIARGKIELDRKPVPLGDVIKRAVEVCMPDIEARGLRFGIDPAECSCTVSADATRLQQVFWNLLRNSVKFTPHGGWIGIRWGCSDDGKATVEVSDSGEGIAPDALARIFNPFEQAETDVSRRFQGLGLGLTISRALVELHGGSIEARSDGKGRGATFKVQLPIVQEAPLAASAAVAPRPAARRLRILLVEDHGDTAQVMSLLLAAEGHHAELAGDVTTALETAARERFDLLLSDLGLPDATGYDLIRELRRRGFTFPGIAVSGYGREEDVRRSHEAGFAAHITKPAPPEKLAEVIARVTGGGS